MHVHIRKTFVCVCTDARAYAEYARAYACTFARVHVQYSNFFPIRRTKVKGTVLVLSRNTKNVVYKTQKVCVNIDFLDNIPYFTFLSN